MNKEYLPFYDSLSQKDKDFWLNCSKETLIDHFISNVRNGEVLLNRIEDAIDYINRHIRIDSEYPAYMELTIEERDELLNILKGVKND